MNKKQTKPTRGPQLGYVKRIHTVMAINRGLMVLLFVFALITVVLVAAVYQSRQSITVYIPPDTTNGALVTANTPSHSTVYGFAFHIMQHLYHWPKNGREDYRNNIYTLAYYLTPSFTHWLNQDYEKAANRYGIDELHGRMRMLLPVPQHSYSTQSVKQIADGVWQVALDFRLAEDIDNERVKDTGMHYLLRVVSADVDRETNQWGLMLDGMLAQPERFDIDHDGK